jgi:hypothetical protein
MELFDFTIWSGFLEKEKPGGIVYQGKDRAIASMLFKVTAFVRIRTN